MLKWKANMIQVTIWIARGTSKATRMKPPGKRIEVLDHSGADGLTSGLLIVKVERTDPRSGISHLASITELNQRPNDIDILGKQIVD